MIPMRRGNWFPRCFRCITRVPPTSEKEQISGVSCRLVTVPDLRHLRWFRLHDHMGKV